MISYSSKFRARYTLPMLLVTLGAGGLAPGSSQAEEGVSDRAIEEILVTARKRTESVLEIPESVSVLSGDAIARQNLTTLADIGNQIPNLNLSMRADGFPNVSIRGVGSFGNTQGVGFYLDDVQLFSDASSRFGDIERVEVLKGPQGTLYGGSNIGGAIKYVSKRPDAEALSSRVKLRAGEQGIVDVEGSVNVPLGDNGWAMRLFAFDYQDDGYLKNPNTPRLNGLTGDVNKDAGEIEESGARVTISGPLTERFSMFAALRWNELEGPNNYWIRELDDSLDHPNTIQSTFDSSHERDTLAGTLELTYEVDSFDIVSLTSYTETDSERYTDVDLREEYIFDAFRDQSMDVFTQEFRVTSTDDGPLQWSAGVFYSLFEESLQGDQIWFDARVDADGNISGALGCAIGMPTCSGVWLGEIITLDMETDNLVLPSELRDRDKTQIGAFVNLTYSWDAWEVNLGLRVDKWENETDNKLTSIKSDIDDTEVLPRFSLTRWVNDSSMVYFTYAEGYEPGGFNLVSLVGVNELFAFDAENATSYELGWKARAADSRWNLTVAGFFIDYEKRQIEFQLDAGGGQIIEGINNIGDSEQYGIEAEASFQVTEALRLSASFGWVDAEWDSGTVAQGFDLGGDTPPGTQDTNWNVGFDYERPMGDTGLNLVASMQVNHSGEFEGLQAWDTIENPDYTLVDAQIGLVGDRWEVQVAAKNLFDEDHYVDLQRFPNLYTLDGGENVLIGTLGQPRLITGSVTFHF